MKSFLLRQGGRDVSTRQETIRKRFPTRHDTEAAHSDGKLYAKSFLHGMTRKLSVATGNYSQKVSYTAWDRSVSPRQETICEKFLIRHDTEAVHSGRKLFAKSFLYGMTRKLSVATGNYLQRVFYPPWHRSIS